MSDAAFINSYNEIVFDNFIAVLKQNLMFQTQLKLIEGKVARVAELEKQLADSGDAHKEVARLRESVQSLTADLNTKNTQLQQQAGSDAERHRIQTALNDKMRECETLRASTDVLNRELQTLSAQAARGQDAMQTVLTLQTTLAALERTTQEQTQYIQKLEELLPPTKRKKLGLPVVEPTINIPRASTPVIETTGGIF